MAYRSSGAGADMLIFFDIFEGSGMMDPVGDDPKKSCDSLLHAVTRTLLPPVFVLPATLSHTLSPGLLWLWPGTMGVLTLFGLLSALLGQQGLWLVLSWGSLAILLITTAACLVRAWCRPSSKGGLS
ncbi:MAG: hypothetical protein ABF888_00815 [Acetobacter papayae]